MPILTSKSANTVLFYGLVAHRGPAFIGFVAKPDRLETAGEPPLYILPFGPNLN